MNRPLLFVIALVLVPAVAAQDPSDSQAQQQDALKKLVETKIAETQPQSAPAEAPVAPGLHPRVKLETTRGDIVLELDAEKAPITTHNFIRYAEEGFYDDTIFHRVIKDFMIQGGGWTSAAEQKRNGLHPPIKNEWNNGLKNKRGTIAMARGAEPDSATAQFFINVVDNAGLDQPREGAAYAAFGYVVEGLDVVDQIRESEVHQHPKIPVPDRQPVTPVETVVIKSAKLISAYDREKVAETVAALEQQAREEQRLAELEAQKKEQELLSRIETETGQKIQKTDSGLMYVVLEEGTGPVPKPTDKVEVHYTGWLADGTKFDSSVDRGQPAKFELNRVIPGWSEGVGMMKVGGKRKLIIPYQLAYGERGRPGRIPPKATLVFDVELLSVVDKAQAQAARRKTMQEYAAKLEAETGHKAIETPSGLIYIVLQEGEGPSPKPTDMVEVHYTGWLLDGTKFDSSTDRGQPVSFRLSGVIRGWTEGVGMMKVGEKRKLIIPPEMGYGERGAPPNIGPDAILVFEVELLAIK